VTEAESGRQRAKEAAMVSPNPLVIYRKSQICECADRFAPWFSGAEEGDDA
jgi:hypothetical protein